MKKIEKYICEYCGMEYDCKERAIICESQHVPADGVAEQKFDCPTEFGDSMNFTECKYPAFIKVRMKDGEKKIYMLWSGQ